MGTILRREDNGLWLYQGDAFKWLKKLSDESVDLIVTDYPYESLEKHRKRGTTTRLKHSKASSNDWFGVIPNSRLPELLFELFRVLKRDRHLYMFCDDETSDVLKGSVFAAVQQMRKEKKLKGRLTCWKRIVWDKMAMGMGYHYRARYEFILFFEKGKRKLNNLGIPDVLEMPGILGADDIDLLQHQTDLLKVKRIRSKDAYPTEKPAELIQILVENSTQPGELVIDPFMGSGSTGEAALKTDRYFWGNDIAPSSLEFAERRLTQL
jgi:site-specific DNA-methyltransferase (adenine-specific)